MEFKNSDESVYVIWIFDEINISKKQLILNRYLLRILKSTGIMMSNCLCYCSEQNVKLVKMWRFCRWTEKTVLGRPL